MEETRQTNLLNAAMKPAELLESQTLGGVKSKTNPDLRVNGRGSRSH